MILEMQLLMHIDLGRVIHFQTILSILQKTRLFTKKQWISWQIQLRVRENTKNPRATGIPNVKVHMGIIRKWTNKYGLFEMVISRKLVSYVCNKPEDFRDNVRQDQSREVCNPTL